MTLISCLDLLESDIVIHLYNIVIKKIFVLCKFALSIGRKLGQSLVIVKGCVQRIDVR
jgi:hypothetical protein